MAKESILENCRGCDRALLPDELTHCIEGLCYGCCEEEYLNSQLPCLDRCPWEKCTVDNTSVYVEDINGTAIKLPDQSDWKCYLFGGSNNGMIWTPNKGEEPNFFWRYMQYLIVGNRWVKN